MGDERTVIHHLADDQRDCPQCGGTADRPLGTGKQTRLYEYLPGYSVRQCHVQEKAACSCGQFIATADPPMRPVDGGRYGAGGMAHIAVMKCADSIPLHRLARTSRQNVQGPVARVEAQHDQRHVDPINQDLHTDQQSRSSATVLDGSTRRRFRSPVTSLRGSSRRR